MSSAPTIPQKSAMDQAREAWNARQCVIDGKLKIARKHWFCTDCWKKLPADIQSALRWQKLGWIKQFQKAMEILQPKTEKA